MEHLEYQTIKEKSYPYHIAKKYNLKWFNYGLGGSTLTDCSANGQTFNGFMTPYGRYTELDDTVTPEYISIFFGWNDGYWGAIQEAEKWLKDTYSQDIYYPAYNEALIDTIAPDETPYTTQAQYDACNSNSEVIGGVTYTGLHLYYMKFLGDIDSVDVTKYYGAYNVLLEYLILKYPYAKILLIIPYNNYIYNPYMVRTEMQEAVKKRC